MRPQNIFGGKIETSLNLFSLFISRGLSFSNLRLNVMQLRPRGTNKEKTIKNWLQSKQQYSDSVFNFYFIGKKIRRQMSSNLISTPLDELPGWYGEHMRRWRHNLCALRLVRWKAIDLFSTASLASQESYLTNMSLDHLRFFPPARNFCTAL